MRISVNSPSCVSTSIAPACCLTIMSWLMERPRPVPSPVGLVVKNGLNIFSFTSDWEEWIACIVGLWIAVSLGAGLPVHESDVHKSGRPPLNCVPRAAPALADPLRFVSRKGIG